MDAEWFLCSREMKGGNSPVTDEGRTSAPPPPSPHPPLNLSILDPVYHPQPLLSGSSPWLVKACCVRLSPVLEVTLQPQRALTTL